MWEVRRAADRAVTSTDWLHSAHSFAFGQHYDPANLSFGLLRAHNVDEVRPGPGYPPHRHAAVEILTWVLSGTLEHSDAEGDRRVGPGTLQYLSAGTGIEHAERSGSAAEPVRVVQMWLAAEPGGEPRYQAVDVALPPVGLTLAASGARPAPIGLRQPGAELFLGRLPAGAALELPVAPYVHLFLLTGSAGVREPAGAAERLGPADALRITDGGPGTGLVGERDAELMVWAMAAE
ncbi:MAG: pirin family protein [Jatrophihabitantaceae bacterium]